MISALLLFLIRIYRYTLSFWVGQHCRFYPTCSAYAESAIEQHGCMRGSFLALKRLLRCHPWHRGGEDPLPKVDK